MLLIINRNLTYLFITKPFNNSTFVLFNWFKIAMEKNLLILCTGNSCRSQMAEGFFRFFSAGRFNVYSAGIESHGLNPMAVEIMAEEGIDISNHTSDLIERYDDIRFEWVITVCDHAAEVCPVIPNVQYQIHHSFTDPSKIDGSLEEIKLAFGKTRDEIKLFAKLFCQKNL
tara:strand:- start:5 stop:517 length:513 start_codon:yes stop_codon:yes gene_type:complete